MITVNDQPIHWHDGMTVASMLDQIGAARHCAVIKLNGKLVCRPKFDVTCVPDQATILLLPMIAGG